MDDLKRLYLSIHPVRDINFESLFIASLDYYSCLKKQKDILHCTVLSATALKYPPPQPYTKSFLKAIINQLEKNGHEVDEELYLTYTNLLQISNSSDEVGAKYSYMTYTLKNGTRVTLKETSNLIAEGTTGLRTWQASHVLLDYLLDRPSFLDGRRVLELGAGLGLLGIGLSLSRCPLSHYTLTDLHPTVLDTLEHNVSINIPGDGHIMPEAAHMRVSDEVGEEVVAEPSFTSVKVDIERLDWEDEDQLELLTRKTPYDLILASDVVFDPSLYRPLLRTISSCLNVSLSSNCTLSTTISSSGAPSHAGCSIATCPSSGAPGHAGCSIATCPSSGAPGHAGCSIPTCPSSRAPGRAGCSIATCSQSENRGDCKLNKVGRFEPEHFSKTEATPTLGLDGISIKCDSTSKNGPALLGINGDNQVESLSSDVCLLPEERRVDDSQCLLVSRSPSKSRRPMAILAATVRNEEALDSFLSLLGVYGLLVRNEVEKVYKLSASQPEHRVRILHIEATTLCS